LAPFSRFFRSCTRDATATFGGHLRGLFQSERANMLRMSEVNAVDHQSMQHLLTEGAVDWDGFGDQLAQEANALPGGTQSVLLIDESSFAKKGKRSVGVDRQWNGRLGKVDNCQVGGFAALCRGELASLVDARLNLPQAWAGPGRRPQHPQAQSAAVRVDHWAAAQPADAWQRWCLRGGEKGQRVAGYLQTRVWVRDPSQAQARCWHLFVRREVGASEISHYCLSNAPEHTPWTALARVQAQRFFIEHSFREAKSEGGLANDQVRRWDAWHHHMALVMLATLFLVKQKIQGRAHWPMLSFNDLVTALAHLLPRRQLTAGDLAAIINNRHRLRERAKESHARRAAAALE